jgi:hypothetical protein
MTGGGGVFFASSNPASRSRARSTSPGSAPREACYREPLAGRLARRARRRGCAARVTAGQRLIAGLAFRDLHQPIDLRLALLLERREVVLAFLASAPSGQRDVQRRGEFAQALLLRW